MLTPTSKQGEPHIGANTKPPFEQGLRAEGVEQRDVYQGGDDPPDTEAAGEGRVNFTKQALKVVGRD